MSKYVLAKSDKFRNHDRQRNVRGVVPGGAVGAMSPPIQLTLSQPRGAEYAQQIILAPPEFQTFLRPRMNVQEFWNEILTCLHAYNRLTYVHLTFCNVDNDSYVLTYKY